MTQPKDKKKFKGRNVSVPSLTCDDAIVNTSINTNDNDGLKCCGKCNKIVKD